MNQPTDLVQVPIAVSRNEGSCKPCKCADSPEPSQSMNI